MMKIREENKLWLTAQKRLPRKISYMASTSGTSLEMLSHNGFLIA